MSSSEDKEGAKPPKPPDDLNLGSDSSNIQGSAGFDQQHNPDPSQATVGVSQPSTLATTAVSQTSSTAITTMSQDNQATVTVSQPFATATTTVSLQTMATSSVSQSTMSHDTVSSTSGDASQSTSSISTAAGELEAVINQAFPEVIASAPQGPVTGDVLYTNPPSDPQGSANSATSVAQQLTATSANNNQYQVIAQIHTEDKASQSAG